MTTSDELNSDKHILLVEFNKEAFVSASPKIIPRFQPMHLIKGDLATIESEIKQLALQYDESLPGWLDIEVNTQDFLNDLQQRIQAMVADLPLEVLLLRRERKQKLKGIESQSRETLQELTPRDVFEKRLALEAWDSGAELDKKARITQAFEQVVHELAEADKL